MINTLDHGGSLGETTAHGTERALAHSRDGAHMKTIDRVATERRLAAYARYGVSAKGRARTRRYNRTPRRLKAQRERNQVRRERAMRHAILTLGGQRAV